MRSTSKLTGCSLLLGLLGSACAFGDRHVRLEYPPTESAVVVAVPASATLRPRTVHLGMFVDQRAERGRVGEVRNGWGMHTADVVADNDVSVWVHRALRHELEAIGLRVVADCPASGALEVRGEVLRVHCGAFLSYEGEVQLSAELVRDGKVLARYPASGKGSAGTNWGATEKGYGESLALALQAAARTLAGQLAQAIRATPPSIP